jgi:hypothetical protein
VKAGTQSVARAFPLIQALKDGAAYYWDILLTPTGSNNHQMLAEYTGPQPVARGIVSAIEIPAFPPVVAPGSSFATRVKYVAAEPGAIVVNLLDNRGNSRGSGTVLVSRGDGILDVPIAPAPGMSSGDFVLVAFLSDSPTNGQTPMARAPSASIRMASVVGQDFMDAKVEPGIVLAGEVFRFTVSYAARTNRDLHIDLFDARTNYLASAFQPVPPGSGVRDLTISQPGAAPGNYFVTVFLTPTGESWKQAVAWGAERPIVVIGADYQRWVESWWGVLLGNDRVAPQDDPDGDGASNGRSF